MWWLWGLLILFAFLALKSKSGYSYVSREEAPGPEPGPLMNKND